MIHSYSNTKGRRVVKVENRVIGYLKGNAFIKTVIGSKHQLRKPPAWAIDAETYEREIRPSAAELVIIDKESGITYSASVQTFDRLKGELDRGFGRQYFLTLKHWEVRGNGHHQLSLWGGNQE